MQKEYILCSAIHIPDGQKHQHQHQPTNIESGFVICGRRYSDCYQVIKSVTSLSANQAVGELIKSLTDDEVRKHQGFITSTNRYVDRREAWLIAEQNNQIAFGYNVSKGNDAILISENLYLNEDE